MVSTGRSLRSLLDQRYVLLDQPGYGSLLDHRYVLLDHSESGSLLARRDLVDFGCGGCGEVVP